MLERSKAKTRILMGRAALGLFFVALLGFWGLMVISSQATAAEGKTEVADGQQVPEVKIAECVACGAQFEPATGRIIKPHAPWCPYAPQASGQGDAGMAPPDSAPVVENPTLDYTAEFNAFITDEAEESNTKGTELYEKGEWAKALKYFERAAKYRPDVGEYKTNIKNAADQLQKQKERERREKEWKKRYEEDLRRAMKAIAALKKETARVLENLSCTAYWSLQSASAALSASDDVTKNLDDDWARARRYGELAAGAMEGRSRSGWPGVKISIPELPPPIEANPQVRLYTYIVEENKALVPAVIKNKEETRNVTLQLETANRDLAGTQAEKSQLDQQIAVTRSEPEKAVLTAKKKEAEVKEDILSGLADELRVEADEQKKRGDELQSLYDELAASPDSAQQLLEKRAGAGIK
jgi:tetratricopeptide (TPR) repeat protein